MDALVEIFFVPPMAIARVGSSSTPMDAFRWADSVTPHGGRTTVIEPAISFRVLDDGSIEPFLPESIRFKDDDGSIRPVAPFIELWGTFECAATGHTYEKALTISTLGELGATLGELRYEITAGNRKAARRTGDAACGFIARVTVAGDNHHVQRLLAFSPHNGRQEPLVFPERPIQLGSVQVIRPTEASSAFPDTDLSVLRLRFVPAKGKVFGTPASTYGPTSPVPQGIWNAPQSEYGRIHEIVVPPNRILNDNTPWSEYIMLTGLYEDPQPEDGYDGADVGNWTSRGVVDDTCDAVIEATLVVGGRRFVATQRIFCGPPDFAPDRRPIYSIADDLADREMPKQKVCRATYAATKEEILDLFARAFETASLMNLDQARTRALQENALRSSFRSPPPTPSANEPLTDAGSMTLQDRPYVDLIPSLTIPQAPSVFGESPLNDRLPYTSAAQFVHAPMIEEAVLIDFLIRKSDHVRGLIRPPVGSFSQLAADSGSAFSNRNFRDPRRFRDTLHDMRMPPYMRDANRLPLSISRRWYQELMDFLELLAKMQDDE
jgi:hypothetical protein